MIKRAFTLVELLIVIVIVWIFFSLLFSAFWSYLKTIHFKNNKELFLINFDSISSHSMSSSYYNWKKFDKLNLVIWDQKSFFTKKALSWSNEIFLWKENLDVSVFSWFTYSWNSSIDFNTWNIFFESYKLGCYLSWSSNRFTTWNVYFDLKSTIWAWKYCFKLNLESCRLVENNCD